MWPRNASTERLGLGWPIVEALRAPAHTPALAAASNRALNANLYCHEYPGDEETPVPLQAFP